MKKSFVFLILVLFSVSSFAAQIYRISSDVTNETHYVKIIDDGQRVTFQFCDYRSNICDPLGPQRSYSKAEIKHRIGKDYKKMIASGVLDIGVLVVAAFGGYEVAAAVTGSMELLDAVLTTMGIMGLSATVSEYAALTVKAINPMTYKKRANIEGLVISHRNVTKHDIVGFRNQLEEVLHRL